VIDHDDLIYQRAILEKRSDVSYIPIHQEL